MSITEVPISILRVLAPSAASSGNGDASYCANFRASVCFHASHNVASQHREEQSNGGRHMADLDLVCRMRSLVRAQRLIVRRRN